MYFILPVKYILSCTPPEDEMGRHSQLERDAQAIGMDTEDFALMLVKQYGDSQAASRTLGYPASTIESAWRRKYTRTVTQKVKYVARKQP